MDNCNELNKNLILTGPEGEAVDMFRRAQKEHTEFEAENINTKDQKKIHHHLLPSKDTKEIKCLTVTTS